MAKVFGITPIELQPGVKGEDFEKFFLEEYGPLGLRLGWDFHILKADRGERAGKYVTIWEIPSVENRDGVIPPGGQITEEALRLLGPEFQTLGEKLDKLVVGWPYTDYIELGK